MCAINDPVALALIKERTSRIIAFKIVTLSGKPLIVRWLSSNGEKHYKPGWNYADVWNRTLRSFEPMPEEYQYDPNDPAGIHCYLNEQKICDPYAKVIEVEIEPQDVLACEPGGLLSAQIVARKVWIDKKELEKGFRVYRKLV